MVSYAVSRRHKPVYARQRALPGLNPRPLFPHPFVFSSLFRWKTTANSNYSRTSRKFARKSNHSRTYAKTGGWGQSSFASFASFASFTSVCCPFASKSNYSRTCRHLARKSNYSRTYANPRGWGELSYDQLAHLGTALAGTDLRSLFFLCALCVLCGELSFRRLLWLATSHSPPATNSNHSCTVDNCCPTSRTSHIMYHYITYPCRSADILGCGTREERTASLLRRAGRGRPLHKTEEPKRTRPLRKAATTRGGDTQGHRPFEAQDKQECLCHEPQVTKHESRNTTHETF